MGISTVNRSMQSIEPTPKTDLSIDEMAQVFNGFEKKVEEHLGLLLLSTQKAIEEKSDKRIRDMDDQIVKINNDIKVKMEFQDLLKAELDKNPNASTISFADKDIQDKFKKLYQAFPRETLKNLMDKKGATWTRAEAETFYNTLKTDRDDVMRQYNHLYLKLNRSIEDRHEMLKIFREMLEMLRKMIEGFNNRASPR